MTRISPQPVRTGRHRGWLRAVLLLISALALTATSALPAQALPARAGSAQDETASSQAESGQTSSERSVQPGPTGVRANIVKKAKSQIGYKEGANNCNKYGKCEPWCAWFATWVWKKAGGAQARKVKRAGFTGTVYNWGKSKGLAHKGTKGVKAGDMVFYGSGPSSPSTSTHVDIVIKAGKKLTVVGGNLSNKVMKRTKGRSGIYGYIRPYK